MSPPLRKLIRAGNAARDKRDWVTAARFYTEILEAEPAAPGIEVQLGHMLKEMGAYDQAEQRYRAVLAVTPNDDDLYLQLGHLAKMRQNLPAAMAYYRRALELNGENLDARMEYEALGGSLPMADENESTRIGMARRLNAYLNTAKGMLKRGTSTAELRLTGDRARDARRWLEAARSYQEYLSYAPGDVAIWVQLGHCLKESGDLVGGEAAYRAGLAMDAENADLYLHLGHVLKLQNRLDEAVEAYQRSFELLPSKSAHDELLRLHGTLPACPVEKQWEDDVATDLLYFEIDDLLNHARHFNTLSGIQRVGVNIIQQVLAALARSPRGYAFVLGSAEYEGFWKVRPVDVKALIDYLLSDTIVADQRLRLVDNIERHAIRAQPLAGQCYFVLGAFWAFSGNSRHVRLKAAGVVTGAYIYDMIPLTHPEFCDPGLVNDFTLSIGDSLAVFDFLLTISEFTAQEVRRFQEKHNLRRVPVQAVPLAHLMQEKVPSIAPWTGAIAPLRDKPFVLSVSTIEPRKNHPYLVTIWKLWLEEGLDPPDLVIVGRYGWRMADFKYMLDSTGNLDGRVHLLHDLNDAQLERLYQSCLFTAFPSFIEGWGLPVGESLAHGRPCIASSTTSIPEVGGDLVDYIDPYNIRAGLEVFRRMAFDTKYRAGREKAVREGFVARTWGEVGDELLTLIARFRKVDVDRLVAPLLLPGELFRPGELCQTTKPPTNYPSRPLRPILKEGWNVSRDGGSWMRGSEGLLHFRTPLNPGTQVVVYLRIAGASWCVDEMLDICIGSSVINSPERSSDDGDDENLVTESARISQFPVRAVPIQEKFRIKANYPFICHAVGEVGSGGTVEVRLRVIRPANKSRAKFRPHWVGLIEMAYAEEGDARLRVAIPESMALGSIEFPPARERSSESR